MTSYLKELGTRQTPQSQPIPGSTQVKNSAGGFVWQIDCWARLRRFLILGSEGGSYYASQSKLTRQNLDALLECIAEDGPRTVATIAEISHDGRAPKNDPAILALAAAASCDDAPTRKAALEAVPVVCRIGTHLFMFCEFVEQFRGWGRGLRKAVGRWYTEKSPERLAYQLVKYRQRDGWSHRDVLRLAHPGAPTPEHVGLYDFVCGRATLPMMGLVEGFSRAQQAETPKETAELVRDFKLPREAVKPEHLTSPDVWFALLEDMPMTALIRNLATLTRVGLLTPMSNTEAIVLGQLADAERLRKARVHPIQVLAAMFTYASGRGVRGQHTWDPVGRVVDALDAAFYASFGNVEPSGKKTMLALDVSGSMWYGSVGGVPELSPLVAEAAMALVTANVEPQYMTFAFATDFRPFDISPRERLDDVARRMRDTRMGGTDCALPMLYAQAKAIEVDTFVVYTDNETWAGRIHPSQALQQYRRGFPGARLAVVGMVSNGFSIADPNDPGMLDVVGFDTSAPQVISDFSRGSLS